MKCRLCFEERTLSESHIIPEFLYRPGYDKKHRIEWLRQGVLNPTPIQKGLREKLLCSQCENLIANQYEDYFAKLWYIEAPPPSTTTERFLKLKGLDYSLFKLFHLSILWRASISSLASFSAVSLGPDEDRVRQMLTLKDPGQPSEFQVFGIVLLFPDSNEVLDGLIASPTCHSFQGSQIYMFVFGGCAWFYVTVNKSSDIISRIALSASGTMTLPVRHFHEIKPLDLFFRTQHI